MQSHPSMLSRRRFNTALGAGLLGTSASSVLAQAKPLAGQTVKIVFIDPLSGLMGPIGSNELKTYQFLAEKYSASNPAGVRFEIVPIDNKLSPTESLNALKSAIDQGARFVTQGNGSSVALALVDGINKHNERNPGKEIILLNFAAVDPDLTNSKCSFWHFRYDADTTMKMEAMTTFMKGKPDIKKVYLLNQNYSHGQQVVKYAKEGLKRKRPDIEIVGEDLHPLAQVRDFSPYVAKVKATGADTVITGNWGSDLALLVKAATEGGYDGKFYTYYTSAFGTPASFGSNGAGKVFQIGYSHFNIGGQLGQWAEDFRTKTGEDLSVQAILRVFETLGQAMANAKSTDPVKVAFALEGLKMKSAFGGDIEMRKSDHQLQQTLYMSVWQKADAKYPYKPERTEMTLAPVAEFAPYVSSTPTSCQMTRPTAT